MKIAKIFLVACSLAVLTTGAAISGCTQQCVQVDAATDCQRCVDVGYYTTFTCVNSGACGCLATLNTCDGSGWDGQAALAAVTAPVEQGAMCPAVPNTGPVAGF